MSAGSTAQTNEQIEANRKAWLDYINATQEILGKLKDGIVASNPPIDDDDDTDKPDEPPVDEKPTDLGELKPGAWNPDPKNWIIEEMTKKGYEGLWKILDPNKIPVAHKFASKENAQKYIDYMLKQPIPDPEKPIEPLPPIEGQMGPYPSTGKVMQSTTRGPTIRNYKSGKPSDWTVEKNVKDIPFKNYQFIIDTTVTDIEHDDNISLKGLGKHMKSKGWYDFGISFEEGLTCGGVEPKHPTTTLCVVEGDKIGSIVGKRIKAALCCFRDKNYVELWTNKGDGWKLNVKGSGLKGLKPNMKEPHEVQQRIDGFPKDKVPKLHLAIVEEIASDTVEPTQPPIEPYPECPEGQIFDEATMQCVDKPTNPYPATDEGWISANNWSDGKEVILTSHMQMSPNKTYAVAAGAGGRKLVVDGKGKAKLSGNRARIYIFQKHYNAVLETKWIPQPDLDNLSLKLRSRHQEADPFENRFGGYGSAVRLSEIECKSEPYHNTHVTIGRKPLERKLENGKPYGVRFTLQDNPPTGVNLKTEIDYMDGKGYVEVANMTDKKPQPHMTKKELYDKRSYAWIRINGTDSVKDIELWDVSVKPLVS